MKLPSLTATALFLALPLAAATCNVRDFGATGNGRTLDTAAIQKAVSAAHSAGGGTVLLPPGVYLTGPFRLASGVDLHLQAQAIIRLDDDLSRYPIVKKRYQDGITVADAHDVAISGQGVIDGQGAAWWQAFRAHPGMTHRPYLIKFLHCTRVRVTGVTLRNSPMFHLVTQDCDDVTLADLTIQAPERAPNTDGIDPSGWNYLITRCHIDTGDDDIAIKPDPGSGHTPGNCHFVVSDCRFGHGHGMSIGGGSAGGLEDLLVTHCTFDHTDYGIRIKTLRGNGGRLQHCTYANLRMTGIQKCPISIVDYYPERNAPRDPATEPAAAITDRTPFNDSLLIENVTATGCPNAGVIRGLPEAPVDGLTFSNVQIHAATGMVIYHAKNVRFIQSAIIPSAGPALKTFDASVTGLP